MTATNTASTDTATTTKLDEIRDRHRATKFFNCDETPNIWNAEVLAMHSMHQDREYLLDIIERIEDGVKFRWSDNEGEVTSNILKTLNA